MIRYDLASLVANGPAKGTRVLMSPIEDRASAVRAYVLALRKMLKALAAEVRNGILPAYRVDRLTRDVDQNTFNNLKALTAELSRITGQTVERILNLEAIRHTDDFRTEARKALGVDLTAVVKDEDLDEYMRRAIARNTSLIKSLSDDMVKRVEQAVTNNEIAGRSVASLKKELVDTFGIVDRRAQLIARDQTAKLNADMNRIRQEQAGIKSYVWTTARDERVRQLHQAISGNEYKWGESTGAEGGLPPGQPIQCRCIARAVVSFGERKKKAASIDPGIAAAIVRQAVTPRKLPPVLPAPADRTLAKLEADAKSYVVTEGLRDGKEHLTAYDDVMMLPVEKMTSGKKGSVEISPALSAAISNERNSIIVHHNHPGSSSFSPQDLDLLSRRRGMKGIWAHGHNGSSYYAERGTVELENWRFKSIQKTLTTMVRNKLPTAKTQAELDLQKPIYDAWNAVFFHIISLTLDARKQIKYSATLVGKTAEAAEHLKDEIAELVERLK